MAVQSATRPLVVGFALDVSGSMRTSLQHAGSGELSRLDGIRRAIRTVLEEARRLTSVLDAGDQMDCLTIFAYTFGLRLPGDHEVCDLFRLLEVEPKIRKDLDDQIQDLARELQTDYESRLRSNPESVALEVMGRSALKLRMMPRSEAERILRGEVERHIAAQVRNRVVFTPHVLESLEADASLKAGDVKGNLDLLLKGVDSANDLLGGNTPMRKAFEAVLARFRRELARAPDARCMLFVVSDGQSTDGNPGAVARRIRELGVTIIACFIAQENVGLARRLATEPPSWNTGASTMFDIASEIVPTGQEELYLRRCGWEVPDRSRLFAQANHSDHLTELMSTVLAPIDVEHSLGIGNIETSDNPDGVPEPGESVPLDRAATPDGHRPVEGATHLPVASTVEESAPAQLLSQASDCTRDYCPHECCLKHQCVQNWIRHTGYGIAFRILRDHHDAEDALQDSCVKIITQCRRARLECCKDCRPYGQHCCLEQCPRCLRRNDEAHWCPYCESYSSLHPCCRCRAWLVNVIRRSAIELARRESKHRRGRRDDLRLDELAICEFLCRFCSCCVSTRFDVRMAVDELAEPDRTVVRLYYFDNCSRREIAETLGMSESGVCRVLARAHWSLREILRSYDCSGQWPDGCCQTRARRPILCSRNGCNVCYLL
jgi:DNA-directed RNA polymerase specialized sigma24 family protein